MMGKFPGREGGGVRVAKQERHAVVGSEKGKAVAIGADKEIALSEVGRGGIDNLFVKQASGGFSSSLAVDRVGRDREGKSESQ